MRDVAVVGEKGFETKYRGEEKKWGGAVRWRKGWVVISKTAVVRGRGFVVVVIGMRLWKVEGSWEG